MSLRMPSPPPKARHDAGALAAGHAGALSPDEAGWVQALEAVYDEVARTRMAGLPVMHPALRVQAVGFGSALAQRGDTDGGHVDPAGDDGLDGEAGIWGVLITPWFMNLVWRADHALHAAQANQEGGALAVGQSRERHVGGQALAFMGAWDERLGAFECCSLISPMFQFADQAAAVAVAQAVLAALRVAPSPKAEQAPAVSADDAVAARRRFLFGRPSAAPT